MILCCGEALIDMIPTDDGSAFAPIAGGSVFNTAIGLGRQGAPVGLLSGVSNDLFGVVLTDALSASNVGTDHLVRSDRPTTLAFVKLVDGKASYAFYDENTAGRLLEKSDMPQSLPADVDALFFGGISLAVEPCADTYLDFLARNASDKLTMVDPNIRPSFVQDEARFRTRMDQIISHCDIVKISDDDLEWFDTSSGSLADKAASLIAKGPKLICLTKGSEGVEVHDANGLRAQAKPSPKEVVDTVGAGDAFSAGFLTGLHRSESLSKSAIAAISDADLQAAIDFATAFSADTVTRKGSDPAWNYQA